MARHPHWIEPAPWPPRGDLRDRLIEAGVEYVMADLLATVSQFAPRSDIRDRVRSILRWT